MTGSTGEEDLDAALVAVDAGAQRASVRLETQRIAPRLITRTTHGAHVALVAGEALILPGDEVRLRIRVGAGCTLHLSDIGGTVAYGGERRDDGSSEGRPPAARRSRWLVDVEVAAGGVLVWDSRPLVVADGADLLRTTRVRLGDDAVALLRETIVLGRSGEQGGRLMSHLRIDLAGRPLLVETLNLAGAEPEPGVLGRHRVIDSIILAGLRPVTGPVGPSSQSAETTPSGRMAALDGPGEPVPPIPPVRTLALDGPGAIARHLGPDTHSSPLHHRWPEWLELTQAHSARQPDVTSLTADHSTHRR